MHIGFVNQPYDRVVPPGQNSIGLIVYNTALELAGDLELTLFGSGRVNTGAPQDLPFATWPVDTRLDDRIHAAVREVPRWTRRLRLGWVADSHPQYVRGVGSGLDHRGVDLVHVMNYWSWCRQLRGNGRKRKLVLEMQCEWLSQKDRGEVAAQLEAADAVVGVSDHIVNLFREVFPDYQGEVATAYNGVDVDVFTPLPEEQARRTAATDDGPRILFVGRISPEKGIHTLVEAFALVTRELPGARLDMVGARATLGSDFIVDISADPLVQRLRRFYDGSHGVDYQRYLDGLVARLGIADRVRFAGPMPHQDLVESYRTADLVVNPSLSESFGISMVEGMSSAVPVVGTTVGGMKETVVHGETGLLVPAEEPEALAAAMLTILRDPVAGAAMGRAGRTRVVETFSWEARATRLKRVYHAVS